MKLSPAHGNNVVNVMVDFRALDTLGGQQSCLLALGAWRYK